MSIEEILKGREGEVEIKGWLHGKRSSGGIQFLTVRDGTGFMQCTLRKDLIEKETFEEIEGLPVESAIEIFGTVKKDPRAPYGYEVLVRDIKVLSRAQENFPIAKKYHGPEFLLDNRHFWIRGKKMNRVMRVRAKILEAAREWFKEHGFLEVQVPMIVGAACEGGSTLFELKYFDSKAYLTQSWQLYGEAMIFGLGKCYTIAPSFRAERSKTRRHLTEFWHLEAEMPFCGFEELMKIEEGLIAFILQKVAKECEVELRELGRDPEELMRMRPPFPRIRYEDAIKILQEKGIKIKFGDDLGADEERVLALQFKTPFFLTHFPRGIKAFYHKPDPKDPKVTLSIDMLAPEGYGEIIGSGERIESFEELMKRIEEEKLDASAYRWYLDLRKFGSVQHAGFGLGIERFVMWICKLKHIRDATAFPRLINRVYP